MTAAGDVPLPLRGGELGGPWARLELRLGDPTRFGVDGLLLADPAGGSPGSVRPGPPGPGVPRLLATPPAWPGDATDEAPGAPRGNAAAFGQAREDVLLAACYAAGLAAAERARWRVLGIASLGAAAHPFPVERAAKIALGHAVGHLARRPPPAFPERIVFFVSEDEAAVHRHLIETRADWAAGRRRA